MHGPLPEATQSTTVYISYKFSPPVSGLLSSVEAQISATRASTSVVFASGPMRKLALFQIAGKPRYTPIHSGFKQVQISYLYSGNQQFR